MARLSVNLNKIALLRNARRTGVPDVAHFAQVALASGARGITVHPRP
ncbi:MAG: pyridoxine 5'-phosphate synthase, partial [Acetobacteraceae bacterium]